MIIHVIDDLVIEVWFGGGDGDRPMVKIVSKEMESDGIGGAVVVWPEEIESLIRALRDAARLLEEDGADDDLGSRPRVMPASDGPNCVA